MASFTAIRISAIIRWSPAALRARAKSRRSTSTTTAACASFPPTFVGGVVDLYRGLAEGDESRVVHAYESWGFVNLSRATVDALNIWARFIYGPLIDDRVRTIADGVKPGEYGRREIATVMQALKAQGGALKVPREFVFMDRAAIGLGGAFLRLGAELNFHRLFEDAIEGFDAAALAARQSGSARARLRSPEKRKGPARASGASSSGRLGGGRRPKSTADKDRAPPWEGGGARRLSSRR